MTISQFPPAAGGIPTGNTADRPASPVIGDVYYNGQTSILEIYDGTNWIPCSSPPGIPTLATPTDASSGDAYTSTAGKLSVVFTAGTFGGKPSNYLAYTTAGGHSASSSSSTVTITGLTPGTSYTLYGAASNDFAISGFSGNTAAVTPSTKPEAPTIGSATTSSNTTSITVNWTLGSNGGKNLTAITITPYLNGTTAQTSQTAATTSSTSHQFTGLTQNSSYTFKVKTTNANGDSPDSSATGSVTVPVVVDFLLLAGGGGGGGGGFSNARGGGGGAGGYRTSTSTSGGGAAAEGPFAVALGTAYTITVGAGGAGGAGLNNRGTSGSNSVVGSLTSTGGGGGGAYSESSNTGGSGGGGGNASSSPGKDGATGTNNQGYAGGNGVTYSPDSNSSSGGGGGASAVGGNGAGSTGGNGGAGLANDITGTSVTRGGGGGGGAGSTRGNGGSGGGGNGGQGSEVGSNATVNQGAGGGGGAQDGSAGNKAGGNGSSGVIVLKCLNTFSASFSGGVTSSSTSTSGYNIYTVTAAGTSDTVTFNV